MFRVGQGFDVHKLVTGRKLILGGIEIPYHLGLLGHSDADVLIHSICDALLGAAALGDIGEHFPDSDPAYSGISSMKLLSVTMEKLSDKGYKPVNIDTTIFAEKPKLSPYKNAIQENIVNCIGLDETYVNIKATTTEGLGFNGRCEGISASSVVMIKKK